MHTPEGRAAYINAMTASAMIEAMGMAAENDQHSENQPYQKKDFDALIEKYGIHNNGVITLLNRE